MEALIRTASVDEATAHLEAFVHGSRPMRLWLVGGPGSGKSFLAAWARQQSLNGKRGAILDGDEPDPAAPFWAVFRRQAPTELLGGTLIEIGRPEYERKLGVLEEWAAARSLVWTPRALEAVLKLETDNLQRLRSVAERTALESILVDGKIKEVDVLRTLSRIGYLDALADR